MSDFISENIISENGLTASTSTINTIDSVILSATTMYGDGSNITNTKITPGGVDRSIQFNNTSIISGTTSLLYDYNQNELLFTGTTRFNGSFFQTNSPSVKQIHQWGGTITAGAAPGIIWTNMPLALSTWLGNGTLPNDAIFITDVTEYTECRLFTSVQVAAATAGALIKVQYATTIAGVYSDLVSVTIANTTGAKDSGWVSIPNGINLIFIRLVGSGGNGTIDPRFSPPILLIR